MLNIHHILFPIDFSERCCSAAPFVEAMANRYHAKVTLLSVAQPFYFPAGDGPLVPIDPDELLGDLRARLENSLEKEFAGLPVERIAELGDPARVITDFARTHSADLIMIPSHGYGPFRVLLLGSVTAKVLHDAECPVWTAAHTDQPQTRDHIACRNILCAVDSTPASVALIKYADELAKDTGAALRLVHVIPGISGARFPQLDQEFEAEMRKEALKAIQGIQESAGVKAPLCVAVGNVAESIHEEAHRHRADLVVIGRGALQEKLGRLRTHAYGIIRRSPCPVLSV